MSDRRYYFEEWALDCERGVLATRDGDVVLRPKTCEVLQFIVENAGRVLSREELLDAVWPGISVTEDSLTQCVSELRQALGDSAQRVIKTLPKRGYLFAAQVRSSAHGDPVADRRKFLVAADPAPFRPPVRPTIAVLPFTNLSGDPGQDYLSDGMTEDIINGLSHFSELAVIASHSSFTYKGRAIDVRAVGRRLGARYIVEGSVRRFGDRIRITAQLVGSDSGVRLWGKRFDRSLGDVFALLDEITQSIVRIVVAYLGAAEGERVARTHPSSWTSGELLMQGDQALRRLEETWNPEHLYQARNLFLKALASEPADARIHARLAFTYIRDYADPAARGYTQPEALSRGYELSTKAVSLQPNLPYARAQLGWAYFWMGRAQEAVREFEQGTALNPNFSDFRFPIVLVFAGEPSRALQVAEAHLQLDPFHPPQLHGAQGHAFYMLQRYADAVEPLRECIRRGPGSVIGNVWLAATLIRLGERKEAEALAAEVRGRFPHLNLKHWPSSLYRRANDAGHMVEALRDAGLA